MMVSMKVWVMETRPWRAGWCVLAAAAAMAAEPMPDSLEKMPRATPYWIAMRNVEPAKPPTAPRPVKAPARTMPRAWGTEAMLTVRMYRQPPT